MKVPCQVEVGGILVGAQEIKDQLLRIDIKELCRRGDGVIHIRLESDGINAGLVGRNGSGRRIVADCDRDVGHAAIILGDLTLDNILSCGGRGDCAGIVRQPVAEVADADPHAIAGNAFISQAN